MIERRVAASVHTTNLKDSFCQVDSD